MYAWSKTLAVALVVTLCGYGAASLQAKDHNHKDQSCQPPSSCPAPVLPKPAPVESSCCPMPTVQSHCGPPVQTGCCPVDPEDVSKAQKAALHAQHEAAEACKKQQEAIAKANHEIDEKYAKEQARIDRANAKLNHEVSELQDANAKYEGFYGAPSEAAAQGPSEAAPEMRLKPEPEVQPVPPVTPQPETPGPISQVTPPQPQPQEEIAAVIETTPAQEPTTPTKLPRTAGEMSLIGLIGMVSLAGGYLTRFRR